MLEEYSGAKAADRCPRDVPPGLPVYTDDHLVGFKIPYCALQSITAPRLHNGDPGEISIGRTVDRVRGESMPRLLPPMSNYGFLGNREGSRGAVSCRNGSQLNVL